MTIRIALERPWKVFYGSNPDEYEIIHGKTEKHAANGFRLLHRGDTKRVLHVEPLNKGEAEYKEVII